jgi:hypothetical protein
VIELNLTPDVSIIESIRANSKLRACDAYSELIDNALDWHARRIELRISREEVRIRDDGEGCGNLGAMLRLAMHNPDGRRIGRYGVGFNHAAIWLGKAVAISTVHRGNRSAITLRWEDLFPEWRIKMNDIESVSDVESYMDIAVYDLTPRPFQRVETVERQLRLRYPFLREHGRQLVINGAELEPLALPNLTARLDLIGEWQGHVYRLTAGVTEENIGLWQFGFTVMLRDRVIDCGKSYGCGDHGTNRFFALVELLEGPDDAVLASGNIGTPWAVDQLKSGLTDEIIEFLESLNPHVEPILKSAETSSTSVELRLMGEELSGGWLNDAISGGEKDIERRPNRTGIAAVAREKGEQTDRTRRQATNSDDRESGSIEIRRGVGRRVRVQFANLGNDRIAQVDHNSTRTSCTFNLQHPFVEAQRKAGTLPMRVLLASLVCAYWLAESSTRKKMLDQLDLFDTGQSYLELERAMAMVGRYLSDVTPKNGKIGAA